MVGLQEKYKKEVVPAMIKKFGYKNAMAVPRIEKAVINTGFGRIVGGKTAEEQRTIEEAIGKDLSDLTGQHPVITKAKHSISGFKVRKGMALGAKVTLRGVRMYDFLERVLHIGLPRSRDFRGLEPSAVDQKGNLTIGIREHIFFPEISLEKARIIFGLQVTITTSARTKEEGVELFRLLGFPLKNAK